MTREQILKQAINQIETIEFKKREQRREETQRQAIKTLERVIAYTIRYGTLIIG